MLTKARVKNFKKLSSLCPKKISIMNSPRRPLFSEIYIYIFHKKQSSNFLLSSHGSSFGLQLWQDALLRTLNQWENVI